MSCTYYWGGKGATTRGSVYNHNPAGILIKYPPFFRGSSHDDINVTGSKSLGSLLRENQDYIPNITEQKPTFKSTLTHWSFHAFYMEAQKKKKKHSDCVVLEGQWLSVHANPCRKWVNISLNMLSPKPGGKSIQHTVVDRPHWPI